MANDQKKTRPFSHILITGASSGIGAALALHYANNDVTLSLTGRSQERLEIIAEQCRQKGASVASAALDVRKEEDMRTWILKRDDDKPIDLLIANAGISGGTAGYENAESDHQVREIFDINVNGVLNSILPIVPRMIERKRGNIAIMSSLASFSGWPGAPSYSASKGAVRLYAEALAATLHGTGVKVHAVCPGFIKTPMTDVNPFPMPFMMESDTAAKIIARRIIKGRTRIAFPFATYLFAGFLGMLPNALSILILRSLPQKP